MRIDLIDSNASEMVGELNSQSANTGKSAPVSTGAPEDRTTLTLGSAAVSSLASQAMSSPEIRQELVQSLKQEVESGQYQLDPDKIAGAMIDEHA